MLDKASQKTADIYHLEEQLNILYRDVGEFRVFRRKDIWQNFDLFKENFESYLPRWERFQLVYNHLDLVVHDKFVQCLKSILDQYNKQVLSSKSKKMLDDAEREIEEFLDRRKRKQISRDSMQYMHLRNAYRLTSQVASRYKWENSGQPITSRLLALLSHTKQVLAGSLSQALTLPFYVLFAFFSWRKWPPFIPLGWGARLAALVEGWKVKSSEVELEPRDGVNLICAQHSDYLLDAGLSTLYLKNRLEAMKQAEKLLVVSHLPSWLHIEKIEKWLCDNPYVLPVGRASYENFFARIKRELGLYRRVSVFIQPEGDVSSGLTGAVRPMSESFLRLTINKLLRMDEPLHLHLVSYPKNHRFLNFQGGVVPHNRTYFFQEDITIPHEYLKWIVDTHGLPSLQVLMRQTYIESCVRTAGGLRHHLVTSSLLFSQIQESLSVLEPEDVEKRKPLGIKV